ncbi:MAG: TadE/TadG family type IV pilus assembly protein [Planctomycetaceae bacterium]
MQICTRRRKQESQDKRSGATLVEMAVVLPVFFTLVFGFVEFGHVFMTVHVLNGAAKQAARSGVGDNSTTAKVKAKANTILSSLLGSTSDFTVEVLDGAVFDDPSVDAAAVDYSALPEADLSTAEPRQLFIVRVSVPYDDIAILGPKWLKNLNLRGQSVMRHE